VGDRCRPKSDGGSDGREGQSGLAAVEEYGWGEKDPLTGLYEGYDLPKDLRQQSRAVGWPELLAQWGLLEYSFHTVLGIDLEDAWHRKSWRWFAVRVKHLLSQDTPLARFFAPDDAETPKPEAPRD
jgi:hypothetical protein